MTGLIKAGSAGAQAAVQSFAAARAANTPRTAGYGADTLIPPAPSAAELHSAALEREIEALTAQRRSDALSAERREKDAFARGETAGRAEAENREDERVRALAQALDTAHHTHAAALEQLEVLTLSVAQAALARIFGDRSRYADMVADALRHQLTQIDRSLVTRLRVAPADFEASTTLSALMADHPDIPLLADPALGSGECRIDLQLGRIDASPGTQWQALSDLLGTLAEAEG